MKGLNCSFLNALVYLTLGSIVLSGNVSNVSATKTCTAKIEQVKATAETIAKEDLKSELLFRF